MTNLFTVILEACQFVITYHSLVTNITWCSRFVKCCHSPSKKLNKCESIETVLLLIFKLSLTINEQEHLVKQRVFDKLVNSRSVHSPWWIIISAQMKPAWHNYSVYKLSKRWPKCAILVKFNAQNSSVRWKIKSCLPSCRCWRVGGPKRTEDTIEIKLRTPSMKTLANLDGGNGIKEGLSVTMKLSVCHCWMGEIRS